MTDNVIFPHEIMMDKTSESNTISWKILSVEDDQDYQDALVNSLYSLEYDGQEIEVLTASNTHEASALIAQNPDIGVILLDVVMETDDSGLRLVNTIRECVGNDLVRIVLLTGQPGVCPQKDIMRNYDIDEYWNKSDLTHDYLQTIVLGNLRTWANLSEIHTARKNMQLLIDASQRISNKHDLKKFTHSILEEISTLFKIKDGGIVCICQDELNPIENAHIFVATGTYHDYDGQTIQDTMQNMPELEAINYALTNECHAYWNDCTVLYFNSRGIDNHKYAILVKIVRKLTRHEVALLQVFCEQVNTGFKNIALHNRLSKLAYTDTVTGLHNKNWMLRQLTLLTSEEKQTCQLFTLQIRDLEYSEVLFGIHYRVELILHLHDHLVRCFSHRADIALFDRDTFIVLAYQHQDYIQHNIEHILFPRFYIAGALHATELTGSLVQLKDTDSDASQILALAKSTLEQAKQEHLQFLELDKQHHQKIHERYQLLNDMRAELFEDGFSIFLQPKIDIQSGHLVAFEALARWNHKNGQLISPAQFIPLAESTGLIGKLDNRILRLACEASQALTQKGYSIPISVNISGSEISHPDFSDNLLKILEEEDITPTLIDIEITETQMIQGRQAIEKHLIKLRQVGMTFSIDDFGAGYSSMAYLSDLKADALKIDCQFVWRMHESPQDKAIIQMIIDIGHMLGMTVIAEGVETQEQNDQLKEMGCEQIQGYLVAKPMSLESTLDWIESFGIKDSNFVV